MTVLNSDKSQNLAFVKGKKRKKKKFYTRMPNIDMTVRIHGTSARTIFSCHLMTSYFFSRQKEQRSEIRVGKKLMHLSNI